MWPGEVVVGGVGRQMLVSFVGVFPVFGISLLAQQSLDKAFCLAIGSGSIGAGSAVLDSELLAAVAKDVGAIAAAVVGEQGADLDAVALIKGESVVEEAASGFGLLIGEQLGKGQPGVVVDGDVQASKPGCSCRPRRRPSARIKTS